MQVRSNPGDPTRAMQAIPQTKLRQIIAEAIFRRKRLVVTTFVTVIALALVGTLSMRKKYEASAKLLVQNVRTASQLTTSSLDHLVSQGDVSPAEINTEVNLLESEGVARRALRQGGAETALSKRDMKAMEWLKHALSVDAVHQTNIIDLHLVANSPEEARGLLQQVIDAYFEERAGTARSSGAAEFFEAQLRGKTTQLDADQAAMTAFQVKHGIADLDDQTKLQVARVSALQDQIAQASASLAGVQGKRQNTQQELTRTPQRSQTQMRSITNQYTQERLGTLLVDLQNRRTELLKRYVPTDRQIVEVDDKIVTTKRAVNEASLHPAAEEATDVNPVFTQLSALLATSGGDLSALEGQRATLGAQLQGAKDRLTELEEAAGSYGDLRRRLQQSQADYTLYAQRRDEARISEALDRQKLFDVAVTQAPNASGIAVRPRPVLYMLTAAAFGLLLSVIFAVYADMASGQAFTPAQLDAWTGMRTWATLSEESVAGLSEGNRRQLRRLLFAMKQAVAREWSNRLLEERTGGNLERLTVIPAPAGGGEGLGVCVAFTSALSREGVSFTVHHLAREASRNAASKVAVLDTQALLGEYALDEGVQLPMRLEQGADHWVLSGGDAAGASSATRNSAKPQFTLRLRGVLRQMRQEFDLVLLDCPSLQVSTLAGELAPCIDGYVAVVRAGRARRHNIEDLYSQLGSTSAPILGHVLNGRDYPLPRWLHKII